MVATAPAMSAGRVWWSAVRPATLAASVSPVLAGTAVAVHGGGARWWAGLGALIVGLGVQLGVNFANDYSDFVRGADAKRVGPVRAASSGIVDPRHVKFAAVSTFGIAGLAGLALSVAIDWRLLLVGAACLLAGWLYTGGPRPYGYLGLGEVVCFVFFGLVATVGTVYVETSHVIPLAVLMGCAMGFLACAILVLNNLRDIDSDAEAGKRTLATRIGRDRTRLLLLALVVAAFLVPVVIAIARLAGWTVLLTLLAAPAAVSPLRAAFAETSAPALVDALKRTAAIQLGYAILFAFGILL
ncbi:MAG TPA: 1,4-dihydroxy-2-naphthoate polyprenyltransferase [Candidatus Dormibacteraeota bacterium]|nr:1,4-dihydroxy-2-naphthoate polyprenyltransferase [Candidatus Dormibacteraeota bacterium]